MKSTAIGNPMIGALIVLSLLSTGCSDWEVRNQRIQPTYVCEGDNAAPVVTWDYSGPKANVRITTKNGEELCRSGAREGYCAFDRPLSADDVPLKVKVYKKGDLKDTQNLYYEVLSGTEETEEFLGALNWSDPYEKTVEEKRPVYDEDGNPTGEVEVVSVEVTMRNADQVQWLVPREWFTSRVITESVKYTKGDMSLEIEGPGIGRTSFNVAQRRPGNLAHPGGTWMGYFGPPLEARIDAMNLHSYGMRLFIRCSE